jgi:hypothetical protein
MKIYRLKYNVQHVAALLGPEYSSNDERGTRQDVIEPEHYVLSLTVEEIDESEFYPFEKVKAMRQAVEKSELRKLGFGISWPTAIRTFVPNEGWEEIHTSKTKYTHREAEEESIFDLQSDGWIVFDGKVYHPNFLEIRAFLHERIEKYSFANNPLVFDNLEKSFELKQYPDVDTYILGDLEDILENIKK